MECCIYALAPHTKHVPLFSICSPPNVFTFAKKYLFAKMYISRSLKPIPWGRPSLISSLYGNRNTHLFYSQNGEILWFIGIYWAFFDRRQTVSTWHERTESTSFTGQFVRLDPPLFLPSRLYVEIYPFLVFPFNSSFLPTFTIFPN